MMQFNEIQSILNDRIKKIQCSALAELLLWSRGTESYITILPYYYITISRVRKMEKIGFVPGMPAHQSHYYIIGIDQIENRSVQQSSLVQSCMDIPILYYISYTESPLLSELYHHRRGYGIYQPLDFIFYILYFIYVPYSYPLYSVHYTPQHSIDRYIWIKNKSYFILQHFYLCFYLNFALLTSDPLCFIPATLPNNTNLIK